MEITVPLNQMGYQTATRQRTVLGKSEMPVPVTPLHGPDNRRLAVCGWCQFSQSVCPHHPGNQSRTTLQAGLQVRIVQVEPAGDIRRLRLGIDGNDFQVLPVAPFQHAIVGTHGGVPATSGWCHTELPMDVCGPLRKAYGSHHNMVQYGHRR